MFGLYVACYCIALFHISDGRTVQAIIGRNVSFSWSFSVKNDAVDILHGSTPFLLVWPAKSYIRPYKKDKRLLTIGNKTTHYTFNVTISILGVTENDSGIYSVQQQFDSEEFHDSVLLEVFGAKHLTTSTLMQGNDAENSDSPPTRNLLFVLLGVGIVLAVGFIACLLRKYRACPCVNRTYNSSSFTHFDEAGGNDSRQEENLPGQYWTIVSNAKGEMSTAIETDHDRHVLPTPTSEQEVLKDTKLEQSIRANDTSVVLELDEYMDPVNSSYEEHDDYIHPVNSSYEEHDDYIHPVNSSYEEHDDYIHPVHSSAEEHIGYIHPVHSDLVNIDVVPKCHTTYF